MFINSFCSVHDRKFKSVSIPFTAVKRGHPHKNCIEILVLSLLLLLYIIIVFIYFFFRLPFLIYSRSVPFRRRRRHFYNDFFSRAGSLWLNSNDITHYYYYYYLVLTTIRKNPTQPKRTVANGTRDFPVAVVAAFNFRSFRNFHASPRLSLEPRRQYSDNDDVETLFAGYCCCAYSRPRNTKKKK